jgi:hypothetical protein
MDTSAFYKSLRHGNLSFDIAACSTIGGASLGLFFFVLDAIEGHAFFTPMLLGSVLFEGIPATEAAQLSVPIIAGYTLVHFRVFAVIGLAASILAHVADYATDPKPLIATGVLAIEIASFGVAGIGFPGVIETLGVARIAMANLVAAAGIGIYLFHYRRRFEWKASAQPS